MALLGRRQISLRDVGTSVTVPNDPKAKLMFYLSCVSNVLDIADNVPRRLTDFANYNRLTEDEVNELLALCLLFSPDVLKDKCFFENNNQGGSGYQLLELSSVETSMLLAGSVVIGGQNRRVAKIMTYTSSWMRTNYEEPMVLVVAAQLRGGTRPAIQSASGSNSSGRNRCCVVM